MLSFVALRRTRKIAKPLFKITSRSHATGIPPKEKCTNVDLKRIEKKIDEEKQDRDKIIRDGTILVLFLTFFVACTNIYIYRCTRIDKRLK